VEQAPGNLTAATFAKGKDRYYVSIRDFKAGAPDNITPIQPQEFEQLWLSLQHPEILAYQFSPDNSDNMANPSYFTIKRLDGQSETTDTVRAELSGDTEGYFNINSDDINPINPPNTAPQTTNQPRCLRIIRCIMSLTISGVISSSRPLTILPSF